VRASVIRPSWVLPGGTVPESPCEETQSVHFQLLADANTGLQCTYEVQPAEPVVNAAPRSCWFQFSLKTLLLAMTGLCVVLGGYLTYERDRRQRRLDAADAIEKIGGIVSRRHPHLENLPSIFGMDIEIVDVNLGGNHNVTNANLSLLEVFPELRGLNLSGTGISDEGLAHLAGLLNLDDLGLEHTGITDAGLVHLKNLEQLQSLGLEHTEITDDGLRHLARLESLTALFLDSDTKVTDAAIRRFEEGFPGGRVLIDGKYFNGSKSAQHNPK
jgi:hypothetical protein